jgi:hypothetical protein
MESRLDVVERQFLWKTWRGIYAGGVVLAAAVVVAAATMVLYTLTPVVRKSDPPPPPPPQLQPLTADELARLLPTEEVAVQPAGATHDAMANEPSAPAMDEPTEYAEVDPRQARLAGLWMALQNLATSNPSSPPWAPSFRVICTAQFYGNCYSRERRQTSAGIKAHIDSALAPLDLDASIAFLTYLEGVARKVEQTEESRARAIDALTDIRLAWGGDVPVVTKAIDAWLLPPGSGGKPPEFSPRSSTEQRLVFQTILDVRKRGTNPEAFAAFLARAPAFAPLAPADKPERLTSPLWPLWTEADDAEAQRATDNLLSLLPSISVDRRPLAVEKFRSAWLAKQGRERSRYRAAVDEQQAVVAANDRDAEERKAADVASRERWMGYGAAAFGATALLALLLVLYGIERNTRLLEAVLRREPPRPADGA